VLFATALLGGALLVVDRSVAIDPRRDIAAGALAGLAAFADPTAVAGAACLAAWLLVRRQHSRAARLAAPVAAAVVLLAVGFARLDGDPEWWVAGGDLPERAVWLVVLDLALVLVGVVALAVRRRDIGTVIALGVVGAAVVTAHIGREGSPGWVWASVLLVAIALGRDSDDEAQAPDGGASSSRSSSVTSRYHMSAQSTQR
jgi:hypothetical protein